MCIFSNLIISLSVLGRNAAAGASDVPLGLVNPLLKC